MKKKITVIIAMLCVMCMLIALCACDVKDDAPDGKNDSGDIGSGEDGNGVKEIQKLRQITSAVLDEFSGRLKASVASAVSENAVSGDSKGFEKLTALQEISDYMDTVENKYVVEEKLMNEIAIRNFIAVRAYGELINEICEGDKIYGVPFKITNKENTIPSEAYAVILSEGSHITAYLYGKDDEVGECVYKWDIDYVNDKEFSAQMMTMIDGTPTYYFYGDTDGESLFVSCNGDDTGVIEYKTSNGDDCYSCDNFDVVNNCRSKIKYQFDTIDIEYLRTLKDNCQYSASQQQYYLIADALSEEYGIE